MTIEQVREVRERLFETGTVVARADGQRRKLFPVAIGKDEGLALLEWVHQEGARGGLVRPTLDVQNRDGLLDQLARRGQLRGEPGSDYQERYWSAVAPTGPRSNANVADGPR